MAEKPFRIIKSPEYAAPGLLKFVFDPKTHVLVAGDLNKNDHKQLVGDHLPERRVEDVMRGWTMVSENKLVVIPSFNVELSKEKVGVMCSALEKLGCGDARLEFFHKTPAPPLGKVRDLAGRKGK
ncbi:MAG: hypothetical protein NTY90_03990 [Candidatus Micrarchaeota archaeon]|nr:hypothetical protein [Candidatus Micrarchaeota archaeon]